MQNDFLADLASTIPDLDDNLTIKAATARAEAAELAQLDGHDGHQHGAVPTKPQDMRGRLTSAIDAERFALAGKSTLTLVSTKTGNRFTYRISATPDGAAHFVGLLNGPDNTTDYKYLGRIARGLFWAGRKTPKPGDISPTAPSALAFAWAWKAIVQGQLPSTLEIWHEGKCGRCGRKLTVPSSVALGFGPECSEHLMD